MVAPIVVAAIIGAAGLITWGGSNIYQNVVINQERMAQLDYQWNELAKQERYLDLREDELEWEKQKWIQSQTQSDTENQLDLFQSMLMMGMDKEQLQQGAEVDYARIQSQFDMQHFQARREDEERQMYMRSFALQKTNEILSQFGSENDVNKLSYIIHELNKIKDGIPRAVAKIEDAIELTETDTPEAIDFDYARGDDLPPEAW